MSQNCLQLRATAADNVGREEALETHLNIDNSITETELCRPRGVPRLFKETGAVQPDGADGKAGWCEVQT